MLVRPTLYAAAWCGGVYAAAEWREKRRLDKYVTFNVPQHLQRRTALYYDDLSTLNRRLSRLKAAAPESLGQIGEVLVKSWHQIPVEKRVLYSFLGINTVVFLLWRVPRFQPFLMRHFTLQPDRPRQGYTLLTSALSHRSLLHFSFNQMALWSFGSAVALVSFRDRPEHMAAFLTGAAVCSSWGSLAFSRLVLPPSAWLPSLGASGSLFGVLGLLAVEMPDLRIHLLVTPPSWSVPLGSVGLPLAMLVDVLGLWRKWRMLDHMAHLSGALLGLGVGVIRRREK